MVKDLLRNHSSVRIYDGNPISKDIIEELITTAQMAATSHFVQAYSVIWVTDEEKRNSSACSPVTLVNMKPLGLHLSFVWILNVYKWLVN